MFTVGWNAAVCVAALCSLLGLGVCKINRASMYRVIEGGETAIPEETEKLIAEEEVKALLIGADGYQSFSSYQV